MFILCKQQLLTFCFLLKYLPIFLLTTEYILISFFKFYLFVFVFGCAGLCCCEEFFSSCDKQELLSNCGSQASLVLDPGLQGAQASVVAASGLSSCGSQVLEHRLNSSSTGAKLLCCMWDLPRSQIEPVSPALAGRFFTPEPPTKPLNFLVNCFVLLEYTILKYYLLMRVTI